MIKIRFRSLESRIATLFLVLIITVQVISLLVLEHGIDRNERIGINDELNHGQKVFNSLVEQTAQRLRLRAQVVVKDTALIQAIGNNSDLPTLNSALLNSSQRVHADFTMLVDGNRKIKLAAAVTNPAKLEQTVLSQLDNADQSEGTSTIAILDHKPYQVIIMPVKAPVTIAWVVMGFAMDRRLANDMKELSTLDAVLLTRQNDGEWFAATTTLSSTAATQTVRQLQQLATPPTDIFTLNLNGSLYRALLLPLGANGADNASVMLIRSIDEATAPYHSLEHLLIAITALGIVLAVIISIITAKRIAQPLKRLADSARQLERGDYRGVIALKRADEIGALAQALDNMRDGIAKREQEISHLAYWDALTSLPNRSQFTLLLGNAIREAKERETAAFVLMMDLDRFKHVNDILGHSYGDAVLCTVAKRLQTQIEEARISAQVARLGGDEFAILLPGSNLAQAQQIARSILRALELPLALGDQTVDIGAGMGIAGFPMHAEDSETLLSVVEVAMYNAKQRNDGAVVYDATTDKASEKRLSQLTELRNAAERHEFRLYVQPKLSLTTGAVVGVESLIRWKHPERGMVFPDEFIPFAEQSGFIRVLTLWVLEQSALLCHTLAQQNVDIKISVNLSTRDLLDQDLPAKVAEILARHHVAPSSFCLEITESTIMSDPVRALHTLDRLHEMGTDLSIDDFGTGYSSLAYLKRLPVDELKIDKSFVMNMVGDTGDTKIVRSTIDLAHNMGLRVVAEGIENEAVWRLLANMGCDQGQGYFMSRPIPSEQLLDWISTWQAPTLEQPENT